MKARPANADSDDQFKRINGFLLNAVEDAPDFRDFAYQPALLQLKDGSYSIRGVKAPAQVLA
jgi:hypothetical protein